MAPIREELSRIGREGFAAIDKVYGCHSSSTTTQWPARHRQLEAHQQQQQQVKLCYSVYRRAEVVSRVYQQTSTTHHHPTNYNYIVHQAPPPQDHDVYNYNYGGGGGGGGGGYGSGNRVLANSKLEGGVIDSKTAARRFGGLIHDVKYYAWF